MHPSQHAPVINTYMNITPRPTQANTLRHVSREIGAVDPEAEEGVGEGGRVVDEDVGDVDVAD